MKGIRFDISDDLHRRLKTKLAAEGRQQKEVFLTLTENYVGDDYEENKKDRPQKGSRKK